MSASLAAVGCIGGGDTPEDSGPSGEIDVPLTGWGAAPAPAPAPAARPVVIELGFPHELPEQPRPLDEAAPPPWTSGRAIAFFGGELFVVDTANGDLVVMDRKTGGVTSRIPVGAMPQQVVVGSDGTAYVSLGHAGSVVQIAPGAKQVTKTALVGTEPTGLALSHDGATLFVALAGDGALVALDATSLTELGRQSTSLARPRAVVADASGQIFVGGADDGLDVFSFAPTTYGTLELTNLFSRVMLRGSAPIDISVHHGIGELTPNRVMGGTAAPGGTPLFVHHLTRSGTQEDVINAVFAEQLGVEQEPDAPSSGSAGGYGAGAVTGSLAPHVVKPITVGITSGDGPGGALSPNPIHPSQAHPVKDPLTLEPLTHLIAQPSDINHHPTWSLAFVTGFGSDNVLVLNTAVDDPMRSPVAMIRVGQAPQAITFSDDGDHAFVLNAHSFTVSEIDLRPLFDMEPATAAAPGVIKTGQQMPPFDPNATHVLPIRLQHQRAARFGEDPLPEEARLGRRVFTYAFNERISRDNQFACRSCHIDGGEDGLVWFITDGPRQTPALAERLEGSHPFNWVGSESELMNNMERTIDRMGGEGLDQEQLESLEQFLLVGLTAPPNPHRSAGGLSEQQERGRQIYLDPEVGCAKCHLGAGGSDGLLHDVGTITPLEAEVAALVADVTGNAVVAPKYNTPSLKNLFATAPYLHDGSAQTLYDVFQITGDKMGKVNHLSAQQLDDLIAYLLTL